MCQSTESAMVKSNVQRRLTDQTGAGLPDEMAAQVVADLQQMLPEGVAVGTVARFQIQEVPRGMEFLYSLNRLNVATSRARCACVLVANPALFEPGCRSVRQMRLANGVCEIPTIGYPLDRSRRLTRMPNAGVPVKIPIRPEGKLMAAARNAP